MYVKLPKAVKELGTLLHAFLPLTPETNQISAQDQTVDDIISMLYIKFCRDFIMSSYQELKKANPTFPILIRECAGAEAKLIARYGEKKIIKRTAGFSPLFFIF